MIKGKNAIITELGSKVDLLEGLSAVDINGNLINNVSFVLPSNYDDTVEGDCNITFSVTDSDGNTVEKTVKVTFYKKEDIIS